MTRRLKRWEKGLLILTVLAEPHERDQRQTPAKIHEQTGLRRGSVYSTLARLKRCGLVYDSWPPPGDYSNRSDIDFQDVVRELFGLPHEFRRRGWGVSRLEKALVVAVQSRGDELQGRIAGHELAVRLRVDPTRRIDRGSVRRLRSALARFERAGLFERRDVKGDVWLSDYRLAMALGAKPPKP